MAAVIITARAVYRSYGKVISWPAALLRDSRSIQQVHCVAGNSSQSQGSNNMKFDPDSLNILVCPLSKRPLRYSAASEELICDDLGVAYPIIDGIPNLNPHDARKLLDKPSDDKSCQS